MPKVIHGVQIYDSMKLISAPKSVRTIIYLILPVGFFHTKNNGQAKRSAPLRFFDECL